MDRRGFMTAVGAGVTTALVPVLPLPTNELAPTIRYLPPLPKPLPDLDTWLLDILFHNVLNTPPLVGALNISLNTSDPTQ